MKTSVIEAKGLFSVLSTCGPKRQFSKLPGVKNVEVDCVAGNATVVYDETAIDLGAIKFRVHECGYHCAGEQLAQRGKIANAVSRRLLTGPAR